MKGLSRKRFCRQEKGFVGRVKRMTNQVKSSLGDRPGRLQYKGKLKRSADSLESGGEEETTGRSASRRKKVSQQHNCVLVYSSMTAMFISIKTL